MVRMAERQLTVVGLVFSFQMFKLNPHRTSRLQLELLGPIKIIGYELLDSPRVAAKKAHGLKKALWNKSNSPGTSRISLISP